MHTMKLLTIGLFIVSFFSGCDQFGLNENRNYGPCVHKYLDPVLTIESVTDAQTGALVSPVYISDISIDDNKQSASHLAGMDSTNISVEDSVIVCTPACGFSHISGTYQFTVQSDQYRDTTIVKEVQYQESGGGCPSWSKGSTVISLTLKPER